MKKLNLKKYLQQRAKQEIAQALNQIDENKYYKELIDNKIALDKIIKVPIIFVGKELYVLPLKNPQ